MNRDDIIRMAREAGINVEQGFLLRFMGVEDDLERFFHMAQAAEREACAQWAEGWQYLPENNFSKEQIVENMCKTIAYHIRARGKE